MVILIVRKIYGFSFIYAFKVDIKVKNFRIDRIELFRDYIMSYK